MGVPKVRQYTEQENQWDVENNVNDGTKMSRLIDSDIDPFVVYSLRAYNSFAALLSSKRNHIMHAVLSMDLGALPED